MNKKLITLLIFEMLLFSAYGQGPDMNPSFRLGAAYNTFEPSSSQKRQELSKYRWIQPTITPFIGAGLVIDSVSKSRKCDVIRVEVLVSYNRSEFITYFPEVPFKEETSGKATLFYSSINCSYGLALGKQWIVSPVIGIVVRTGTLVDQTSGMALTEFGIYSQEKFNNSLKSIDLSIGASVSYKIGKKFFIQADLNYGLIPQIVLDDLPNNLHDNGRLSIGYIIFK
ncbi:MAG: hypothetical protein JXR19_11040 [Bacteroidia bacterium]